MITRTVKWEKQPATHQKARRLAWHSRRRETPKGNPRAEPAPYGFVFINYNYYHPSLTPLVRPPHCQISILPSLNVRYPSCPHLSGLTTFSIIISVPTHL